MKTKLKADIALLLVTLCWGVSYYLVDLSFVELDPFTINAIRFLLAFFVAFIITVKRCLKASRATLLYALILGVVLVLVYVCATFGLKYTSQSNAGFLCALSVVIVPLFKWALYKQKPEKKLALVMLLALGGIALLTLSESFTLASGDIICLGCSLSYAVHLMVMERAARDPRADVFTVGVYQLGFAGVINLGFAYLTETPTFPQSKTVWIAVLILSVFCTGVSFLTQAVAQKYTTAENVGVIFTAEPVFAAIVAFFLAGEKLLPRNYAGMALLFLAILLMELDLKKIFTRRREQPEGPKADLENESDDIPIISDGESENKEAPY